MGVISSVWQKLVTQKIYLAFGVLLVSILQILCTTLRLASNEQLIDFTVYYRAAVAFMAGVDPYAYTESLHAGMQYLYPPASLLFFSWAPYCSLASAGVFFSIFSVTCAVAGCLLFYIKIAQLPLVSSLVLTGLILQTFPFKLTFGLGQINAIVFLLVLVGIVLAHSGKHKYLAGVLFAVAAILKIFPIFLLPMLIIHRQMKVCFACISVLLILLLIFPDLSVEYMQNLVESLLAGKDYLYPSFYDQSIPALFTRAGVNSDVISFAYPILVVGLYCLSMLVLSKVKLSQSLIILLIPIVFFTAPVWQHHLVIALPGLFLILRKKILLLVATLFLMIFHFGSESSPMLQALPLLATGHGMLTLALLVFYLWSGRSVLTQKGLK